jgi:hypothetical protein
LILTVGTELGINDGCSEGVNDGCPEGMKLRDGCKLGRLDTEG